MRSILLFCILSAGLLFSYFPTSAQENRLYRLIKKEDFSAAMDFAEKLLTASETKKYSDDRRRNLYLALAGIHKLRLDYPLAEEYYKKALETVENKIRNNHNLKLADYDVIDEISLFFVESGNLPLAEHWINYSLINRKKKWNKNNPTNYRPYLPLGMLFYYKNEFDSARYYLSQYQYNIRNSNYTNHFEINRLADTYQIIAELELVAGNLKGAKINARKSSRLQSHYWTRRESGKNTKKRSEALNMLSRVYLYQANLKKSKKYLDQAFALYTKKGIEVHPDMAGLFLSRAWIDYQSDSIVQSLISLEQFAELEINQVFSVFPYLSEYEKENFYVRHKRQFESMNALTLEMLTHQKIKESNPFFEKLLNYNLTTKGLIISESGKLMQAAFQSDDDSIKNTLHRWRMLKNEYAHLASLTSKKNMGNLKDFQKEIIDLEKSFVNHALMNRNDTLIQWTRIKNHLNRHESALEIVRIGSPYYVKSPTKEWIKQERVYYLISSFSEGNPGLRTTWIEGGIDLEKRYLNNYFNSIKFEIPDTLSYTTYWNPIRKILPENTRSVFISPDGIFNLLNFDNLFNTTSGRFLFEEYSYYNLTNLKEIRNRTLSDEKKHLKKVCLWGNPDYSTYPDSERPVPLPGSESEIDAIEKLWQSDTVEVIKASNRKASEYQLKKTEGCAILHIASHGLFKSDEKSRTPMLNSALLLAKGDGEDGILSAYEASTLESVNAELVVLSACETGLGTIRNGEGVYGLQRAFELTGAKHIIMSLWKVDDEATQYFMEKFYESYIRTKDPFTAINFARKETKELFNTVYVWGSFKLIGVP